MNHQVGLLPNRSTVLIDVVRMKPVYRTIASTLATKIVSLGMEV